MPRDWRASEVAESPSRPQSVEGRDQRRPLLVVADLDPGLRLLLKRILTAAGYEVRLIGSIQDLAAVANAEKPVGLLVSTSLAGDRTPQLLRSIRARSDAFILALVTEPEFNLRESADDSIPVPFRDDELVLQVAKAHRQARSQQKKALAFIHDSLMIDLTLNEVSLNGRRVSLSPLEFEVLRVLAENEGRIVGHDQILRDVWRGRSSGTIGKLRHIVHLLRLKLGHDDVGHSFIVTDSRAGYGLRSGGSSSIHISPSPRR
jgi:two-component system, OmpR family, KDP operon response regulator KdpE